MKGIKSLYNSIGSSAKNINIKDKANNIKNLYHNVNKMVTEKDYSMCPDLDYKTRIIGFILSFSLGFFMIISSISQLLSLVLGGERWFAIWYTLGNSVCLASTFFLMGPKRQCELMLSPLRATVSLVLFGSMIMSLILALIGFPKLIILLVIFIQFLSLIWYVLSYVPMGQTACGKCIKGILFGERDEANEDKGTEMV